jgi:Arc/MetJ-type ribon-helix-helix transcriptional regulator
MTMQKIAVSLPRPLVASARKAVRQGRASNVSAYVAAALEEKTKLDELELLLDEMLAESGGPMTAAERHRADAVLDGGGSIAKAPRKRGR